MRDGDIDYSIYTLLELEEALAGIDRRQFPKNYANLRSAYAAATRAPASQPQTAPATGDAAERNPQITAWNKFRASRPVAGALGIICLWWAYDVFTQPTCPSARKLMGAVVNALCDNYGHTAAASVPFVLGLVSAMYAVMPKRHDRG